MTSAYAASPVYEASSPQISYLMQRIDNGHLALPDFQRDFVWESSKTIKLLGSIMSRYPVGTLLIWKQNTGAGFAARPIEDGPALKSVPEDLLLDGQQRITSLYRALSGKSGEHYFVRLREFVDEDGKLRTRDKVDFDNKAIFVVEQVGKKGVDPADQKWQFEEAAFPLDSLTNFDKWLEGYAKHESHGDWDAASKIKEQFWAVRDTYLIPLQAYGFPVITLPAETPMEAVCNIFESLNSTGKPLGVFDLLTARFFPHAVNLRDLWTDAVAKYDVLSEFDVEPYDILQAITLRAHNSAQRKDVLGQLVAADIQEHWEQVVAGMASVIDLLQSECGVLTKKWLPYGMILVPMAAVWPDVRAMKSLQQSGARDRMRRYFWCTTFMTNFDQGANSQAGADFVKLRKWVADPGAEAPEAVADFDVRASTLLGATVRRKALHAGVMALTIRAGAKDFHSSQKLTAQRMLERKIESHHVFPRAYLAGIGVATSLAELVLNRALIDSETNKVIGKRAPSEYVDVMLNEYGSDKLTDVLQSHVIEVTENSGLAKNNYDQFLAERLNAVVELIREATEHEVERDDLSLGNTK